MHRRKTIKLLLLGGASITSLISYKWLHSIQVADRTYLASQQRLIAELAETIIPQTDTPGAKAAKVDVFILRMLQECTDARSLSNFIIGLQELEEFSYSNYHHSFIHCNAEQKEVILQEFENRALYFPALLRKAKVKLLGQPFFMLLKYYTVMGFCNSRLGATQALHYDAIPGSFKTIVPINPVQKAWATS